MDFLEILKSDAGSFSGLAKSKKYGLTAAFVSVCFAFFAASASVVLQVALLAAATATVVTYLVSASILEGRGVLAQAAAKAADAQAKDNPGTPPPIDLRVRPSATT